jgi:hypothetical protein
MSNRGSNTNVSSSAGVADRFGIGDIDIGRRFGVDTLARSERVRGDSHRAGTRRAFQQYSLPGTRAEARALAAENQFELIKKVD